MALRTVERKTRTLHTQNKQIRRSSVSKGISPGESSGVSDGQMPKASGRFFMSEDKPSSQQTKDGEIKAGKRRASGKVLHTAARSGMDAVNNHVEGGEELRESEEILMALGAASKRMFQTRKQKKMNRASVSHESNPSVGSSKRSSSRSGSSSSTSTAGEKAKDKHLKNKKDSKKRLREKQRANNKRRRYRRALRRLRKRYEDDEKEEATPIGIKERLIHGLRVRDSEEDSADTLGSVTKGTKGLKRVIKIILFLIKKLITLLMTPFIIVIVIVVIIISLLVGIFMLIIYCSPLSIFFPLPDTGTDDIRIVLSGYYQEFNSKIAEYEADGKSITYQNMENGVATVNFRDTLMVYMTLYADGSPGFVMDDAGKANLKKVFDEMNYIDTETSERQVKAGESLGKVYVTAYCPCRECSGPHGHATASGKKAKENHTVAVDAYNPIVPMGTKVVIDGKVYTVEDTGDLHKYGNEFDIFFENHADTETWGRKKLEVFIADKDGKIKNPDHDKDDGTDTGEPDDSGSSSGGSDDDKDDGKTITVHSEGITVHNLTYQDYINAHPELNDDQKKMLQMLMDEEASIYGSGEIGLNVVQLGMTKLGCNYSQARRFDEGYYDCSSFVLRMYREFGLELPGTAAEQGRYCAEHGMIINQKDLRPGDLIFYSYEKNDRYKNISHVAMYAGDGMMIHAANPRRGVVMDPLRTSSVVFYGRPYIG